MPAIPRAVERNGLEHRSDVLEPVPETACTSTRASRPSPTGRPLNAPWEQIKADYIKGATLRELAKKYGIAKGTLDARSSRGGWEAKRGLAVELSQQVQANQVQAVQTQAQAVQASDPAVIEAAVDMASEADSWKKRMFRISGRLAKGLEKVDADRLATEGQTKKLAEAASAANSVDAIGRRQLGLDSESAAQPITFGVQFNVQVALPLQQHELGNVQDAETVPDVDTFDPGI